MEYNLNYTELQSSPIIPKLNEALLTVDKDISKSLYLWGQLVDCYLCNLRKLKEIKNTQENTTLWVNSKWNLELRDDNKIVCHAENVVFEEQGHYVWNFSKRTCSPIANRCSPINVYEPLIYVLISVLLSFGIWQCCKYFYKHCYRSYHVEIQGRRRIFYDPWESSDLKTRRIENDRYTIRLRALDTFRGIILTLMVFVDYGGGGYWFFQHSPWNGVTFADIVFPWFAWTMGAGIACNISDRVFVGIDLTKISRRVLNRSVTLIALGIIITNYKNNDLSLFRFPGVLQRLGVAYFVVAIAESTLINLNEAPLPYISDILFSWMRWILIFTFILVHELITFLLRVPNCPTGYLGPGGLHENSSHVNCTGGAAGYIDRYIFTEKHIYQWPTCRFMYECPIPYDPEGLLGVLTTAVCVYLGVHGGHIIRLSLNRRSTCMISWFLVLVTIAGVLCGFSKEDGWIPLNKNLWSLSLVLLCSGLAFLVVEVLFYFLEVKELWTGTPFREIGMNSMAVYIGHIITRDTFPWQWEVGDLYSRTERIVLDVWPTLIWIFVGIWMFKRKIFIRI